VELDISRNLHNSDSRTLAVRLGVALLDLAVQKPIAEHPKVSFIWQHNVMLFRTLHPYAEEHSVDLARSLFHYGCSLRDAGQHNGAVIILREAVHIFKHINKMHPQTYHTHLASASTALRESEKLYLPDSPHLSPSIDPPKLVMSIEIGCEHSSVAVAYHETGI
jgi:hypothetical protein